VYQAVTNNLVGPIPCATNACGYEKMYLTMKQRVYWGNMYTDVRNYMANCETCRTAKANNNPVRAKIRCREVPPLPPPEIFQRVHIDHLKISVKGATHGYTHALVMIDAMSLCCEIYLSSPPLQLKHAECCCANGLRNMAYFLN